MFDWFRRMNEEEAEKVGRYMGELIADGIEEVLKADDEEED